MSDQFRQSLQNFAISQEMIEFARALRSAGAFSPYPDKDDDILDYFYKPWKWETEYITWVKLGQPQFNTATEDTWLKFCEVVG